MNIDELTSGDTVTDAGGNDTIRAIFSEDSSLKLKRYRELTSSSNKKRYT